MCGICGFIDPRNDDVAKAMVGRMAHRGPDAEGYYRSSKWSVSLGHSRLSIIDLATGQQPMRDGGLIISYNGEIYNFMELRTELEAKGHCFTTRSDTEVLLKGYREWGEKVVERLNGMWAFALLDEEQGVLFLSRDRFGKKPLYYHASKDFFAFASELSALVMHPRVPLELDQLSLQKYYAYGFIPAPNSIRKDVKKLPGGCNLRVDARDGALTLRRYWNFYLEPDESLACDEESLAQNLLELLDKAVARRMIADVPLGVFLSGGVDSSAITTLMSRHLPPGELKTFSIAFTESDFDESRYSQLIAGRVGSQHHSAVCSVTQAKLLAEHMAECLDEPMGDGSILPTSLLCAETRRHVTVALSGDGADELFAGYDPFRALKFARAYASLVPRAMHKAIRLVVDRLPVSHTNMSLDFKIKRFLRGLSYPQALWNSVWLGALEPRELEGLMAESVDIEEVYSEAIAIHDECSGLNEIDKTLQFYTRLYLQDDILTKVDRASMMHSLEVRSPFLDLELVDLARRIPSRLKFKQGAGKYILKKALRPILPQEILQRGKKGFGMPIGKWLADESFRLDGRLPADLCQDFVDKRYAEHRNKIRDDRAFLWNTWILKNNANIAH
jgi:asparagine synthase (glutamine-hydrolysing)